MNRLFRADITLAMVLVILVEPLQSVGVVNTFLLTILAGGLASLITVSRWLPAGDVPADKYLVFAFAILALLWVLGRTAGAILWAALHLEGASNIAFGIGISGLIAASSVVTMTALVRKWWVWAGLDDKEA